MVWLDISLTHIPRIEFKNILERESGKYLDKAGNEAVRLMKEQIKAGKDANGRRMAALMPATIARKKRNPQIARRYVYTILQARRILYNAINYYKTGRKAGYVGIIDRGEPSRRRVAQYLQRGNMRMIARRFFGLSSTSRKIMDGSFRRWASYIRQRLENAKKPVKVKV